MPWLHFETALGGEKREEKKERKNAVIRFGSSKDSNTLGKASALFLKMFCLPTIRADHEDGLTQRSAGQLTFPIVFEAEPFLA